jgi:TonB family protein
MQANSPNSILLSLTLHAFVAAVLFVSTVYVAQQDKPPVIFELVAGPPTAPDALVAPALGNTTTPVKLEVPKVNLPPEPEPEAAPEPPASEAVPDKPAPKPDTSIMKDMKKSQRMSYKDYLKKHPTPKPSATPPVQRAANVPHIDSQGIANGVRGGSTDNIRGGGGGKALTREEHSELDTYISFLLNALKEAHEPPPGVSDTLEAKVTFDITANGAILYPRISKSSGDRSFDQSVLVAFRRVKSIGPTPNGRPDTWTVTFKMKDEN